MKVWTRIETWDELGAEWIKTSTEAGAIGLLYAAAKLSASGFRTYHETGLEDQARCFKLKVEFFLAYAKKNSTIATTARRLIVNELLHEGVVLSWTGLIESPYANLIDFLAVVHQDLRKQPFPKKVQEFLFQSFLRWKAFEREKKAPPHRKREVDLERVNCFTIEYNRTVPLVQACVSWGVLPQVLTKQWFTPEMLWELRRVAEPLLLASLSENEDTRRARVRGSLTWAMDEEAPRDLYGESGRTTLWRLNGLTVNYLRAL